MQWLWSETNDSDVLDKIADAICSRGDIDELQWLWSETNDSDIMKKITNAITDKKEKQGGTQVKVRKRSQRDFDYDCFICHASEDKESLV